ncbi:MAG: DNA ligase [Nitrospirae bacterium]|nr:DNA ligase [Nitrospirota bacterium]
MPLFTVQKHKATTLHYDFRLEIDGVLKSWAIPKGPSIDPAVKRLAVQVDDHDLDYATFEGVIEEGQYGAGPVIVWDTGIVNFKSQISDLRSDLKKGRLEFELDGKKLKGAFGLFRLKNQEKNWLLMKKKDAHAGKGGEIVAERPESALSDQTIEGIENLYREGKIKPYRCG